MWRTVSGHLLEGDKLARLISKAIVCLALLGVVSLASLPQLTTKIAKQIEFSRPGTLPSQPEALKTPQDPLTPVSELHEALRLPRVDTSLTDEHSEASMKAHRVGDHRKAFEEAVLSLDSTPLEKNELYRALTSFDTGTVKKPNGRTALESVDKAVQDVVEEHDTQDAAARLNNAAAMLILYLYSTKPSVPSTDYLGSPSINLPLDRAMPQELAYQAASLEPSYCPALLNLTLFDRSATDDPKSAGSGAWTDYFPAERCEDPALLYYLAQNSIHQIDNDETSQDGIYHDYIDRLGTVPGWEGLAHSLRGDAYYRRGTVSLYDPEEGVEEGWYRTDRASFIDQRFLRFALQEYRIALALQPDDPSIRHGLALVYLRLGEADKRDEVDTHTLDRAIHEAETALESAPESPRLQQTLVEAYEERGEYDTAARRNRDFLSDRPLAPVPLALVPYTPISHGADRYSEVVLPASAEVHPAAAALLDDGVIEPYVPSPVAPEVTFVPSEESGAYRMEAIIAAELSSTEDYVSKHKASLPSYGPYNPIWGNLENRYSSGFQHYSLLRDDLLSEDYAALDTDIERMPREVLYTSAGNEHVLLLVGIRRLLDQPDNTPAPLPETQEIIDPFLAGWIEYSILRTSPRLEPPRRGNDLFYLAAGNFFRRYGQYDDAIRIYELWLNELEHDHASVERQAGAQKLLGEARYLNGEAGAAFTAFDRARKLVPGWPPFMVRQAFMHEKLKRYDEAAGLYRRALGRMDQAVAGINPASGAKIRRAEFYFPDNYQAAKHLGDVLLKQASHADEPAKSTSAADQTEVSDNPEQVQDKYSEAADAYREALEQPNGGQQAPSTAAANNLGVALLMMGEHEEAILVLESLVQPSPDNESPWKNPITTDEHNPLFRLNLGWAHELNHEPKKAADQYISAVRSDPSFYPALNDLGVLAATEGNNPDRAKNYFRAALNEKANYKYATYNLGVALIRSGGVKNYLAGQHYLARAVSLDRSLSEASYDYIFDNELYFVNLSLTDGVPPNWTFAKNAQNGMGMASLLLLLLLLGRIALGYVGTEFRETFIEWFFSGAGRLGSTARLPRLLARVRDGMLRFMRVGVPASGSWWMTPLALLVSVPATVAVLGWSLLWDDSKTKLIMLATLSYLVVVSLLVHHAGHVLAAWWFRMRVRAALWPAGIVQALLLVAWWGPAIVPMPADVVEEDEDMDRERGLVYLAGPAASIIFASLLFVLYLMSHISLLRLGAIVNLSAAAVSLLLVAPLDGAMVGKGRYVRLLFWVGLALVVASAVVYFSNELYCRRSPGASCWGLGI